MTNASFVDLNTMYSETLISRTKEISIRDLTEDFLPGTNPIKSQFQSQTTNLTEDIIASPVSLF